MIEPMKKVSIVLLNKEKQEALKKLRKLGLVHLEKIEGSSEKLNAFKEYTNNANLSESVLGEIKIPKKEKQNQSSLENEKVISLCSQIVAKTERKKQLMEEISSDATELERFANWGSVSLEDFEYLNQKNIQLKLYEVPVEKYSEIDNDIQTILVNNDKKNVRFLIVNGGEGRPEELMPQAFEVPFPRMSTKLLEEEIKKDEPEIVQIETFLKERVRRVNHV